LKPFGGFFIFVSKINRKGKRGSHINQLQKRLKKAPRGTAYKAAATLCHIEKGGFNHDIQN